MITRSSWDKLDKGSILDTPGGRFVVAWADVYGKPGGGRVVEAIYNDQGFSMHFDHPWIATARQVMPGMDADELPEELLVKVVLSSGDRLFGYDPASHRSINLEQTLARYKELFRNRLEYAHPGITSQVEWTDLDRDPEITFDPEPSSLGLRADILESVDWIQRTLVGETEDWLVGGFNRPAWAEYLQIGLDEGGFDVGHVVWLQIGEEQELCEPGVTVVLLEIFPDLEDCQVAAYYADDIITEPWAVMTLSEALDLAEDMATRLEDAQTSLQRKLAQAMDLETW